MLLSAFYKALVDERRLRMLHLLHEGPLCVCHLEELLKLEQVQVSKQLSYLKSLGLVECEQLAQWRLYSLCEVGHPLWQTHFKILREHTELGEVLRKDRKRRKKLVKEAGREQEVCAQALKKGAKKVGSL